MNKVILDCERGMMSIDDNLLQVPLKCQNEERWRVYTMSPVCLTANSETLVEVKCPPKFNDKTVLIESKPQLLHTVRKLRRLTEHLVRNITDRVNFRICKENRL